MQNIISPNKELDDKELKKAISKLLDSLLEMRPELKNTFKNSPEKKNQLVDGILKVLKAKQPEYTRGEFCEPEFLKKLSLTLMVATSVQNNKQLTDLLKKIFDDKKIDLKAVAKLSPKEFKKLMNEKFTKQDLKQLFGKLEDYFNNLQKDLKKFNIKLKPEDSKAMTTDAYSNLFGLVNSAIAGGHAIPIPQFVGNGLGFNDWNPNDGSAPIDYGNSLQDNQFGDSLGLNAITAERYLSIPDPIIDGFQDKLRQEGLAPGIQPPKLTQNG